MGRVLQHLLVSLSLLVSVDGVSLGLLKTQIASTIFCSRLTNDRRVGTFTTGTSCPGTLNTALDNVCTGGPSTIPATNVPSGLGGFFYATSDDCSAVFGSATDTVLVVRTKTAVLIRHDQASISRQLHSPPKSHS